MKIVADTDIPFFKGVFESYSEVIYAKGMEIDPSLIKDADILVVRTRTKCNKNLLRGSKVKMIATATIGTDHIDLQYCKDNNILVINAPGCNSGGVAQYVYTSIFCIAVKKNIDLFYGKNIDLINSHRTTIGIIGAGHVGSKVAAIGEYLGFEVLRNDPPKEREQTLAFNNGYLHLDDFKSYYSLDYLLQNSDIVTMHTPLDDTTKFMASSDFFNKMKEGALFINSSRGEVVDENALLHYADKFSAVICDVWNNEPDINENLLKKTAIATPHIAGYSFEGKINGTQMIIRQIADRFKFDQLRDFNVQGIEPNKNILDLSAISVKEIADVLTNIFPIMEIDALLRANRTDFEKLRSNYNYRREFYVR